MFVYLGQKKYSLQLLEGDVLYIEKLSSRPYQVLANGHSSLPDMEFAFLPKKYCPMQKKAISLTSKRHISD